MTEEEHQVERAERRRKSKVLTIIGWAVLAGGFAIMAFAASWVVVRSANERQQICLAAAQERQVLRDVLVYARTASLAESDPAEKKAVNDFYDQILARAPAIECDNGSIERR